MNLYHVANGKVFCAPAVYTLQAYKNYVRSTYGSLTGIKFVQAENRRLAQFKAVRGETI